MKEALSRIVDGLEQVATLPSALTALVEIGKTRLRHPLDPPGRHMRVVAAADREYPDYYLTAFHGQPNGYLSAVSARAYDLGVNIVFAGTDRLMRRKLLDVISGAPQRILELGCGTASSTLLLLRRFPSAHVTAVDLSPFLLERAHHRIQRLGFQDRVSLVDGNAEALPLESESFDLVTSTFLHHELPLVASRNVLRETARLLGRGGQLAILDAAQEMDLPRHSKWFSRLVWDPYYDAYKRFAWSDELEALGFVRVGQRRFMLSKTITALR